MSMLFQTHINIAKEIQDYWVEKWTEEGVNYTDYRDLTTVIRPQLISLGDSIIKKMSYLQNIEITEDSIYYPYFFPFFTNAQMFKKNLIYTFLLEITLCVITIICLSSCSSTFVSQIQGSPFQADGMDDEWPEKMLYNAKSDWIYGITHDKENMYVFLEVENPRLQSKILVNGLKVWIHSGGGKKREKGIHFPIGATKVPPADLKYTNLSRVDLMTMQRNYLAEMNHLELIGLDGRTVWTELKRQDEGIIPRIGFDEDSRLLYELKIPFNSYFQINPSTPVSIGFETGSFGRPNQLEGLNSSLGESESLRAQSRIRALSELTVPTEMWLRKVVLSR